MTDETLTAQARYDAEIRMIDIKYLLLFLIIFEIPMAATFIILVCRK